MKYIVWPWSADASAAPRWLACAALALALAGAATRPRYGGTLRVELARGLPSLDPATPSPVNRLLYETLVELDEHARPQPALAISWKPEPGGKRWEFRLRQGASFADGSTLSPADVAASIPKSVAAGETVLVDPRPDLFAWLAAIPVSKRIDGQPGGTGPFRVAAFRPDVSLTLVANDSHWAGRPYLDRIEILFRRASREQLADLDLGRAEVIEIGPEEVRRASSRQVRVQSGPASELLCLAFEPRIDARIREAVALSIDRAAIQNVLLGRQGEISGGLLPQWLSGYAFLFPAAADLARARRAAAEAPKPAQPLTLAFERADPLARVIADRIALNARDAGVPVRAAPSSAEPRDVTLCRVPILSVDPSFALTDLARSLGLAAPALTSGGPESLYQAERELLDAARVVPLFHLPVTRGLSPRVRNWRLTPLGEWKPADVWLDSGIGNSRP